MNNKKGFTLVELLAVIAILAILVIIALPNVINMYTKAQKEAFLTETKKIYSEAEKKYISSSISGNANTIINSEDDSKLDMTGEKLQYCILLYNNGKVKDLKVSNGKWIASLDNSKTIEELTIDDLEEGNLDDYYCSQNPPNVPKPTYCTYDGELVQGAEYVNGQYTYRYMQEGDYSESGLAWGNISDDGWGVQLTDKTSTDPVTSKLCTYINNKPITSMSHMFYGSAATTLDLSSFNTSNVTDMYWMFVGSAATILDLSSFDTSKVTNMSHMFAGSAATTIDLSSFDTSKVTDMSSMFYRSRATTLDLSSFDTSNVTDMRSMFLYNAATTIDLSSFNTNNVTDMSHMFEGSAATTLDLSSFNTSKVTDISSMFYECPNLKTIYASDKFSTNSVTSSTTMFYNTTNLVGGAGTTYNNSYDDKTYARIDGGTSRPGYFTLKTN